MATAHKSVTLDATPAHVWRVVATLDATEAWAPGVQSSRPTSEVSEGLGAQRVCQFGGGRIVRETVDRWEPQRRVRFRFDQTRGMPVRSGSMDVQIEPEGDGARVTVTIRMDLPGIAALAGPFVAKRMARRTAKKVLQKIAHAAADGRT